MGGITPETGFHSVILRPDSVSRVTPPTTMTAYMSAVVPKSQKPTEGGVRIGNSLNSAVLEFAEKNREFNGRETIDDDLCVIE